jgi:PadR family transcriptional regulator
MPKSRPPASSRQGSLEMVLLKSLTLGPMHGYAISQHIGKLSDEVLKVEQGSLYPALDRLQREGWVTSAWKATPTGRHARYYTITASGKKQLGLKVSEYDRIALAITRVIRGT